MNEQLYTDLKPVVMGLNPWVFVSILAVFLVFLVVLVIAAWFIWDYSMKRNRSFMLAELESHKGLAEALQKKSDVQVLELDRLTRQNKELRDAFDKVAEDYQVASKDFTKGQQTQLIMPDGKQFFILLSARITEAVTPVLEKRIQDAFDDTSKLFEGLYLNQGGASGTPAYQRNN